jgi:ATP-binding cassette subfamily B protein
MNMPKENLFRNIIGSHPAAIFAKFPLAVVSGAVLSLTMFLTQRLIDGISANERDAFTYTALLGIVFLLSVISSRFESYLDTQIANRVEFHLGKKIFEKCGDISYDSFENTGTYETIGCLLDKYKAVSLGMISLVSSSIRIIVMFTGMFYYLVMIRWWILPLLLATVVPVFILTIYTSMKEYDTFSEYFPFVRKAFYLSGLMTGRSSIKESRLFQYRNFVEKMWEVSIRKFQTAQVRANTGPRFLAGFCIMLQYAATIVDLFILFPSVTEGSLSVGVFVAVAQAMWSFTGSLQYEIIGMIRNAGSYFKFTRDYIKFINMPDTSGDDKKDIPENFSTIELEDIWFRYAEDSPYVLRGVNLTIHKDKKIGIVGENGSEKSTLIKILIGLLPPSRGKITLDGVPVTDENRYLLRSVVSAVFQEYGHYNLSLSESLALGRPDDSGNTGGMKTIIANLHKEDDFLALFENGMETQLGRERWDGQELSGGQWQTIALARSIFAGRPVLVLDEPTAALDPLAELDVYRHVYQSGEIGAALLVTHRLGAIVMADSIYLLADGRISESGTHDELMKTRGKYAKMFETQRQWYVLGKETVNA